MKLFVILAAFLVANQSLFAATISSETGRSESVSENASKWGSYSITAAHYLGARDNSDAITSILFSGSWNLGKISTYMTQPLTKYYLINKGDDEILPSDTIIGLSAPVEGIDFIKGWNLRLAFSTTLPVSEFSREQGVTTMPKISASLGGTFFDEKLNYSFAPSIQYMFNQYTTTRSGIGEGGGSPLRQAVFTLANQVSYNFLTDFTASAYIAYVQVYYEDSGRANTGVSFADDNALLSENFSINLSASYQVSDLWSLALGYDQSDTFEKTYGSQEFYLFDQYNSQFFFSVTAGI